MKKLIIIILWLISISLNATNYYVKTGGNDAAAGTSDGTAWATITKVNTVWAAGTFAPGDNIYFRRGDSFTGTIAVTESGSAGSVITVGAYGSGADPVINGFATVSSWVSEGGGIYSKAVTCASEAIMLTVDGVNTAMGRTPNAGSAWWMSQSDNGGPGFSSTLTDAVHLNSGTLDWTGAEVVIKVNLYTISHLNVTSHSGSTIGFTETAAGDIVNGYGYFLQNDIRTLDVLGEWFYDGSEVFMFFGAADPDDYVVKIASVNYGVTITNYSYVTFDNLDFEGFNYSAFYLTTCPHITIQNCTFNFMGYNAVDGYTSAGSANTATGLVFSGNVVSDVGSNGVHTDEPFTTMTISNNTFNNLGVIAGQGYKRWIDTHSAVVFGARANDNINTVVEYNTITNAGYCGVYWYGDRATIRYNFINYFSTLLDDGGAIYTYDNIATTRTGTVTYNICLNGTGNTEGRSSSNMYSYGLYTDGSTVGIDLTHNTVAYISHAGYLTNSNLNGSLEDNTFYSCQNGIWVAGTGSVNGMTILRNIMFARLSTQYTAMFNFSGSPLASTTLDYNIYTRPISETTTIYHPSSTTISLATWKTQTGDDVHSATAGRTVSSSVEDVQIHFIYNSTTSNQTYTLSATMVEANGTGYTNTFNISTFYVNDTIRYWHSNSL